MARCSPREDFRAFACQDYDARGAIVFEFSVSGPNARRGWLHKYKYQDPYTSPHVQPAEPQTLKGCNAASAASESAQTRPPPVSGICTRSALLQAGDLCGTKSEKFRVALATMTYFALPYFFHCFSSCFRRRPARGTMPRDVHVARWYRLLLRSAARRNVREINVIGGNVVGIGKSRRTAWRILDGQNVQRVVDTVLNI